MFAFYSLFSSLKRIQQDESQTKVGMKSRSFSFSYIYHLKRGLRLKGEERSNIKKTTKNFIFHRHENIKKF